MAVLHLHNGPLDGVIHEIRGKLIPARVWLPKDDCVHIYDVSMADNTQAYYTGISDPIIIGQKENE